MIMWRKINYMIKEIDGNLLDDSLNLSVIGHQTNCLGVMGAGIARQIKEKYPNVYLEYHNYCKKDPHKCLGTTQLVECGDYRYIANIFGEYSFTESIAPYKSDKPRHTDYAALRSALLELKEKMEKSDNMKTLGLPYKLGCGLAGGDWDGVVYPMIKDIFEKSDILVEIVKYKL